jgi:site-specific recombinase XerD
MTGRPSTLNTPFSIRSRFSKFRPLSWYPHLFQHTMAKQFLVDNQNDLVSLAQILGHESLNTTSRYSQRSSDQLAEATERLNY